jgi:hypothetical protein
MTLPVRHRPGSLLGRSLPAFGRGEPVDDKERELSGGVLTVTVPSRGTSKSPGPDSPVRCAAMPLCGSRAVGSSPGCRVTADRPAQGERT